MHGLLSHRTRPTRYPFRQVINVPLLRKRIHLRIHLVSRSSPRRCILQQQARAVCKSPDLRFGSRDAKKSSVKFLRPSVDRAYLEVDRYVSPRGSLPEVIKYPAKSLCCRMAQSNSKSTLGANIIRIAFEWYKVAIFGHFFLTRGSVKPVFTLIIIVSASNNECNSPGVSRSFGVSGK